MISIGMSTSCAFPLGLEAGFRLGRNAGYDGIECPKQRCLIHLLRDLNDDLYKHPYDDDHTNSVSSTLRGSADQVAQELMHELQQRLEIAGIQVLEARLSHLAYAPEIAAAMLQRQQAGAIIAARKLIVQGAVGMVEHAIEELSKKNVVHLDDEWKATLTGNLLVVLCGHQNPVPVVNTGSLYT